MLIRFLVQNLFSFQEMTEFNMLHGRFNRFPHHIRQTSDIELLKLNVLYGANGAGKSNLIHSIAILKNFVITGEMPIELINGTFQFDKESRKKDIYLGIEFIKNDTPYYYGITINQGVIKEEELLISGVGRTEDKILFRRTDSGNERPVILEFSPHINEEKEAGLFPSFLANEILSRNKPVLFYLRNRKNEVFLPYRLAFEWLSMDLQVILPDTIPSGMALEMETNSSFYEFSRHIMRTFGTGVSDIQIETIPIEDFFGKDNKADADRMKAELIANPDNFKFLRTKVEEIIAVLENNQVVAKRIIFTHAEDNGEAKFSLAQESDGTRRLLEYMPALYGAITRNQTYLIDEIERSIHPLLIKELIKKFSHDEDTKGQLIFSTHESNLLDQDIFRPDEIWFAEKNKGGATTLYALSEFKEHHTKDIRKGYLNGRYGAIPFLANLRDLNWEDYAEAS